MLERRGTLCYEAGGRARHLLVPAEAATHPCQLVVSEAKYMQGQQHSLHELDIRLKGVWCQAVGAGQVCCWRHLWPAAVHHKVRHPEWRRARPGQVPHQHFVQDLRGRDPDQAGTRADQGEVGRVPGGGADVRPKTAGPAAPACGGRTMPKPYTSEAAEARLPSKISGACTPQHRVLAPPNQQAEEDRRAGMCTGAWHACTHQPATRFPAGRGGPGRPGSPATAGWRLLPWSWSSAAAPGFWTD